MNESQQLALDNLNKTVSDLLTKRIVRSSQKAAKAEINELSKHLLALVNQKKPYTRKDITIIKNLALRIRYKTNDLIPRHQDLE